VGKQNMNELISCESTVSLDSTAQATVSPLYTSGALANDTVKVKIFQYREEKGYMSDESLEDSWSTHYVLKKTKKLLETEQRSIRMFL